MELIWALANHEPGKYHVTGFRPLKRPDFTHVISKKAAKPKKTNPTNQKAGFSKNRIQNGGTHARESPLCRKTAHQPRRRTGIGLTDFHGNED